MIWLSYNHHQKNVEVYMITFDPVHYFLVTCTKATSLPIPIFYFLVIQDVEDQLEHQVGRQGPGVEEGHQLAVQAVHVGGGQGGAPRPRLVHHLQQGDHRDQG